MHGMKQITDGNSNTILTNTTYTSKMCTSNHMHSFDLTLQYQNQIKNKQNQIKADDNIQIVQE